MDEELIKDGNLRQQWLFKGFNQMQLKD